MSRRRRNTAAKVGSPKIATTAAFSAVVQPAYIWAEFESVSNEGRTGLPRGKNTAATLLSPSIATPDSRAVRLHELLHARFTPIIHKSAEKLKVDAAAIQLSEDIRLAHIGRKLGLFTDDVHFAPTLIAGAFKQQTSNEGIAFVVLASYGQPCAGLDTRDIDVILAQRVLTPWQEPTPDWLVDAIKTGIAKIEAELSEPIARVAKGKLKGKLDDKAIAAQYARLAGLVQSIIDAAKTPPPPKSAPQSQPGGEQGDDDKNKDESGGSQEQDSADSEATSNEDDAPSEAPPAPERTPSKVQAPSLSRAASDKFERAAKKLAKDLVDGIELPQDIQVVKETEDLVADRDMQSYESAEASGTNEAACGQGWGRMEIAKPDLSRNHKSRVKRLGAPSTDGVFPAHLSRWYVDRAVLSRVGRRPGGTLLVDISGSMNLSRAMLEEIITAVPAVSIAAYSGDHGGTGRMTILAQRGRLVAEDSNWRDAHDGLNVIDGPALAWLSRQPGPRVWLCDGLVTCPERNGRSETQSKAAYEDALRLARLGNIRRTKEYKQAIAAMLGQPSTADVSVHSAAISYGAREKALA